MKRIGDIEVDDRDLVVGEAEKFSWQDALLIILFLNRLNYRGHSDWRIPTKKELNDIYCRKCEIGGFSPAYYWSGTEGNDSNAWYQLFHDGYQFNGYKGYDYRVRCVRSFKN